MNATAKPIGDTPAKKSAMPTGNKPVVSCDIFGTTLTLSFRNGDVLELDASTLNPAMQRQAMLHGLKQKLVDAAAIGRNPATGASATVTDKFDAVKEVFDRITGAGGVDPTWNKVREAGAGGGAATGGMLVAALMELKKADRSVIINWLESKSAEEKTALKQNPRVVEIMARLKAAKSKTTIDSDSLLDELAPATDAADSSDAQPAEAAPEPILQKRAPAPKTKGESKKHPAALV